jgi:CsoR family transcriptional regulator, copper-sensing transcriptional repressor
MSRELTAMKREALSHLKTAQGHLDGIIRMLESDGYCVDVMKQISAVQSSLERADRVMLHNHLETCFSEAVRDIGRHAAIDELVAAVKFTPALAGPGARLNRTAGEAEATASYHRMTTILSLPGISSHTCKAAIEGTVAPIAGVAAVEVDVQAKMITIRHDDRTPPGRLVEALEDQGYHVADAPNMLRSKRSPRQPKSLTRLDEAYHRTAAT